MWRASGPTVGVSAMRAEDHIIAEATAQQGWFIPLKQSPVYSGAQGWVVGMAQITPGCDTFPLCDIDETLRMEERQYDKRQAPPVRLV